MSQVKQWKLFSSKLTMADALLSSWKGQRMERLPLAGGRVAP